MTALVAYSFYEIKLPGGWAQPGCGQTVCEYERGVRVMATDGCTRCDALAPGRVTIQHGPVLTVLAVDGEPERCSYVFARTWPAAPEGALVMPFSTWSCAERSRRLRGPAGGLLATLVAERALHVTITAYRPDVLRDALREARILE
ncbi:UL4 [Suid alphaherpesvirus 1]|jgi:hypothetical protein|uniref:Nuclear protein n=1 Tax=Suid herpesvirus 1 TaxID=10345 RepID=Q69404_SUHV|nr:putative [Suid alphaherpesvirus 1]PWD75688.1 hypothetical protein DEO61_25070 [Escherichia coli]QDM58789.1 UL4 protein [synthetic construct]RXF09751.1 hypothetical protein EG878_16385 [Enterococcus faecalis]TMY53903.1 hypothetical protein EMH17_29200 [Klebsiella pneumoniae]